ncbi:hypothetical protein ILUMI_18865, partial [Ignelater luminosus]
MKYILCLIVLFQTANYSQQMGISEKQAQIGKDCAKEYNIDLFDAMQVLTSVATLEKADKNFKCFLNCTLVTAGDMTPQGELVLDNLKQEIVEQGLDAEKAGALVNACKGATGSDVCEIAFAFTICSIGEITKMI